MALHTVTLIIHVYLTFYDFAVTTLFDLCSNDIFILVTNTNFVCSNPLDPTDRWHERSIINLHMKLYIDCYSITFYDIIKWEYLVDQNGKNINLMTCPQVEDDNNLLISAVLYFTKHSNKTYISRVLNY